MGVFFGGLGGCGWRVIRIPFIMYSESIAGQYSKKSDKLSISLKSDDMIVMLCFLATATKAPSALQSTADT